MIMWISVLLPIGVFIPNIMLNNCVTGGFVFYRKFVDYRQSCADVAWNLILDK